MATQSPNSSERHALPDTTHKHFFVMREFLWGAVAGAFEEGMMHPVDTVKTRIRARLFSLQVRYDHRKPKSIMVRAVWAADGLRGFYRGIVPGVTSSLATGATYFGVIELTKKWIEESHPSLEGHWAHFIAGAVGDTLGSVVYVPCEVMKQRMQVQGTMASWSSVVMKDNIAMKPGIQMYGYYTGMFHAGCSIWNEQGLRGLYLLGCCIRRKCGDTVHMDAEGSSGKRPTSSKGKRKTSTDDAQLDSQTTVWGDKILKGPFPGGPEDPRVLRSFPSHVAAAIWHNVRIARLLAIMEPISQSNLRCACKFYEAFEQVRSILQGSEAEIAATAAAAQAEPATPVPSASTTQNVAEPAAPVSSASATQDVAEPAAAQDVAEPAPPVPSTSATQDVAEPPAAQDVAEPAAAQDVAGRVALPLFFGSSSSFVKNSESKDNPLSLPPPPETPIFWPPDGTLSLEWVRNLMSTFDWASRNLEPNQFPDVFPMEVFDSLVLCAFDILHKEANCIVVDQLGMESTVVVVGDIHGQLHDLLFLLNDAGFPSENRLYVFNGDYVDRGAWGIETFLILLAWKVFLPKSVYLLRGNHESKYCTSVYGFEKEVLTKYGVKGKDVYQKCLECFKRLPLTSIIGKYVYTAHGGLFRSMVAYPKRSKGKKRRKISFVPELSSKLSLGTFEELKKAQRSVLNPPWMGSNLIPGDVLWSDPSMDPGLSLNEERGIGLLWGPDCTEEFLKKFQLKLIIRSHEGPDARDKRPGLGGMDNGFTIDHTVESGKLITLFSAPDYPQFQATEDRYRNKGAYIVLEPPNFDDPVIHSFEAITPRPQANPFYDFEEVADSDQELDFASPSMETSP
ncbi:hypothetical protein C1H46_012808 [Malus baccata]|uniref:Serine/threonine-protein phosphatase n=1 Tax=Malus baccata TaxID=106549 RepID=A0A540MS31_MALBA|nr:hypothetical protein C1H46_012808 [Malus baccata]